MSVNVRARGLGLRANGFLLSAVALTGACSDAGTAGTGAGPVTSSEALSLRADERCEAPQGEMSVSALSKFEAETRITRRNDGAMVAIWDSNVDYPGTGGMQSIGYRVFRPHCERGGGQGWGPVQLLTVPGGHYHSDPSVAVDREGDFYLSFIAVEGPIASPPSLFPSYPESIVRPYVARLRRGATTADAPVLISGPDDTFTDKPWIAITPEGAVAVSYLGGGNGPGFPIVFARSTDHGATWQRSVPDATNNAFLPQVCIGGEGRRIYVTDIYAPFGGGKQDGAAMTSNVTLRERPIDEARRSRAARRGRTPTAPVITPGPLPPGVPTQHLHWSDDDGRTWSEGNAWPIDSNNAYSITTCAVSGKDVWLTEVFGATQDFPPPSQTIRVGHFTDRGATFVGDTVPSFDGDPFFAQPLIVADEEGRLNLFTHTLQGYYDNSLGGRFVRLRSRDGGKTFGPTEALATDLFTGGGAVRHNVGWMGDYQGGEAREDGTLDVTFVAPRQGIPQHVTYLHLPR